MTKFEYKQHLSNYPDLQASGINDRDGAWDHWYNYGLSEGRTDKCNLKVCVIAATYRKKMVLQKHI